MGHDPRFAAAITAAVPRARIKLDGEGWPYVPARYGRLEWRGHEPTGKAFVYAYTDRARLITRLRDILHRRPTQHGDQEAVYAISTEDLESIRAAAAMLKIRVKARRPGVGRSPEDLVRARQARRLYVERQKNDAAGTKPRAGESDIDDGHDA